MATSLDPSLAENVPRLGPADTHHLQLCLANPAQYPTVQYGSACRWTTLWEDGRHRGVSDRADPGGVNPLPTALGPVVAAIRSRTDAADPVEASDSRIYSSSVDSGHMTWTLASTGGCVYARRRLGRMRTPRMDSIPWLGKRGEETPPCLSTA